jgi:hypothetical protein
MDLIKSTKISYKDWVHLRLIVSSNIEIMNNNVILFIKIESEATQSYNVPLDTLYDNAMYFYNKNERGNVLNMDLNYEHWLGIIGTSFQVGVVNKQTGKYEMVINDDNQNSNTYIPAGIGPLRPVPMKDSSQGGDDNPILLNSQTAEAGVLDDVQTPEAVKKWINSMQSRLRSIQMNGSITVLGDPNIYDNIEHLDNKYIELAVYDNEQQIVPGYSSKYKVLAWEHNIEMGKWVTKIYITSLYQEDNVVLERYKRNNFVEK